jgi:MEMO1 family protein
MQAFDRSDLSPARAPVWAGQFYPDSPKRLREAVDDYLSAPEPKSWPGPKAIIAPHAGYCYSGPIAGSAFKAWRTESGVIRRVVLLGPSHRVPFEGVALTSVAAYSTPLGEVSVDRELARRVAALPGVEVREEAHTNEHALEVELPFLQRVLEEFDFLPVVVGQAHPAAIAELLNEVWGDAETRIVISSDLSHYLPYAAARARDDDTSRAIEGLDWSAIEDDQACGHVPIRGLLEAARQHGLTAHTVDLRNSGDTAGSRDRVVGYGAFAFS